ncbi:MAG TPA: hypothetical protein VMX57_05700, partial [Planctomycetota bacterium]|nr:hypothetical protein [Planctomycetota bacterium]
HVGFFSVCALVGLLVCVGLLHAGRFTEMLPDDKTPKKGRKEEEKAETPTITKPVMFNTVEADDLLSRMRLVPKDSPWLWDVSELPVARNSKPMIAAVGANDSVRAVWEMAFVIVPRDQKRVPVRITQYPRESDKGPYPVPGETPIQGWPMCGGELSEIQRNGTGDRHAIVLDPCHGRLYEFYDMRLTDAGWTAAQASIFDLTSNRLRPRGWTSADAAGLPILPGVVRYDEVERGIVSHAVRVTVNRTRREYIYPARHFASPHTDPNLPAMGQRLRLRADFDVTTFPRHTQAVLLGMKKYGLIVCDNGGNWDICLTPDRRIEDMHSLARVKGSDLEVVDVSELVRKAAARNP